MYLTASLAVLTGVPAHAFAGGLLFGLVRGLCILAAAPGRDPGPPQRGDGPGQHSCGSVDRRRRWRPIAAVAVVAGLAHRWHRIAAVLTIAVVAAALVRTRGSWRRMVTLGDR